MAAKMTVTFYDTDDNEMSCTVGADDEACAIGLVLDQLGESIAPDSPFAVWRSGSSKRKGLLTKPKLTCNPKPIPTQKIPERSAVKPTGEVAKLLASLKNELGVEVEQ